MSVSPPMLNEQVLKDAGFKKELPSSSFPERVLQVGEGNFLRGFIDWMIFEMNKAGEFKGRVVAIQPTPRGKVVPKLNRQDGLYTLIQRGMDHGDTVETIKIIDSISRGISPYSDWSEVLKVAESPKIEFVFSNTTEAGLQFMDEEYDEGKSPLSYPGKLVALLYHRYKYFNGEKEKGWIILPCELVERNGEVLKEICEQITLNWGLPSSFWDWVESECTFCNTLVDRIVTGFPYEEEEQFQKRLGYEDILMTVAEPYHLFVIEGPAEIQEKLPFKKAGLNVHFDDISSYRELKVKLLNAPHTILASIGILSGIETVREGIQAELTSSFIHNALTLEIKNTLKPEEKARSNQYIHDVIDRFSNPFLQHKLLDISLNGFSKFRTRVLPCIIDYQKIVGVYPKRLLFSLAALISFYRVIEESGQKFWGEGVNGLYEIKDDSEVLLKFQKFWRDYDETMETTVKLVKELIKDNLLDENRLDGSEELYTNVSAYVLMIQEKGIQNALEIVEEQQ